MTKLADSFDVYVPKDVKNKYLDPKLDLAPTTVGTQMMEVIFHHDFLLSCNTSKDFPDEGYNCLVGNKKKQF